MNSAMGGGGGCCYRKNSGIGCSRSTAPQTPGACCKDTCPGCQEVWSDKVRGQSWSSRSTEVGWRLTWQLS